MVLIIVRLFGPDAVYGSEKRLAKRLADIADPNFVLFDHSHSDLYPVSLTKN